MPAIRFEERSYSITANQSVLELLESEGHSIPSACRSGVCQSCLMKATEGNPPADAQKGLKDTLVAQGYFLSCRCTPEEDLTVALPNLAGLQTRGRITGIRKLAARVIEVAIEPEAAFAYHPGQFLTLIAESGVARSYSIASVPALDQAVILQVALLPNGAMSTWLASEEALGATITMQGPHGNCFYVPGKADQPLLLVGTGTGLAPLYAIVRDALHHGHTGPIYLYQGSLRAEGLYCVDTLRELAATHENFHYTPCVLEGDAPEGVTVGSIDALVQQDLPKLTGFRAYLCGAPDLVKLMQRKVFLAGVSMQEIFSDPFVPAAGKN